VFDSLDLKIINLLKKNARTPFVDIAEQLKVSPGVIQARYVKMKKAGLILGTTLLINETRSQIKYHASIGIEALEFDIDNVIDFIYSLITKEAIITCWKTFGRYNIAAVIYSKNLIEVHKIKQLISQHPSVRRASINLNNHSWLFHEKIGMEKIFG
jgi:Lrp/AsnC family transcriptional regulator, regulator for asnA, asnC and gidA